MEGKSESTKVATKASESPIIVPNLRGFQSPTVARASVAPPPGQSKYIQLLNVIEELGRDVRPTYAGSRSSAERIKRGIVHARILAMFSTLDTYDTEYSADSVEWCPAKGFRDLFVCGTYQLVTGEKDEALGKSENSEKRVGKIDLFRIIKNGKLRLLQTFGNTAVLDMKWTDADIRNKHFLGVVTSRGYLQIYSLEETEPAMKLVAETRIRRDEKEVSALSLDWNTGRWKSDSGSEVRITVSDSEGFVSLYKFNGEKLTLLTEKKLHRFEAWISAFDYWTPDIIYSGGDDCKFHRLDARMGLEPIGGNRVHGAGVTSLRSNAGNEYSLASGSYDEVLRLWDTRNIERPISETRLGGGIWRLKWEPFKHEKLLAACMYSGFRLIDCKDQSNPQIIDEYNEHESIAYGCDWSLLPNTIIQSDILDECSKTLCLVATCSFYDHTLKFSSLDLPID